MDQPVLARKATAAEQKGGTAKSRGFGAIPDKPGYSKVYMEYGPDGAGYYYTPLNKQSPIVEQRWHHEMALEQALRDGKPVPPEVLADYPDLAKKYGLPHETTQEANAVREVQSGQGLQNEGELAQGQKTGQEANAVFPQEEGQVTAPAQENRTVGDPQKYAASNAASDDLRASAELDPLQPSLQSAVTREQAAATYDGQAVLSHARQIVEGNRAGVRPPVPTQEEVLHMDMAAAEAGQRMNQAKQALADAIDSGADTTEARRLYDMAREDVDTLTLASKAQGTEQSRAFSARNSAYFEDLTPAGVYRDFTVAKGAKLTDAEAKAAEEMGRRLQKAESDIELAKARAETARAQERIRELEQQARVAGRRGGRASGPRTAEQITAQRQAAVERIKARFADAAANRPMADPFGVQTAGMGAKLLADIAPDVMEVVRLYAEEGIVKLSEVVARVRHHVGEDVLSEGDVQRIIAGDYEHPPVTRSEAAKQVAQWRKELSASKQEANKAYLEAKRAEAAEAAALKKDAAQAEARARDAKRAGTKAAFEQGMDEAKLAEQMATGREGAEAKRLRQEALDKAKAETKARKDEYEQLFGQQSRLEKSIAEYDAKIKSGEFPERAPKPAIPDDLQKLYVRKEALKVEAEAMRNKIRSAEEAKSTPLIKKIGKEVFNVPRSFVATLDMSTGLNQGMFAAVTHPGVWGKSVLEGVKSIKNEADYYRVLGEVRKSKDYDNAIAGGLKIGATSPNLDPGGDMMLSKLISGAWEVETPVGKVGLNPLAASERAYVATLEKLRMDLFSNMVKQMEKPGLFGAGGKRTLTLQDYKDIAEYVNTATGAGTGKIAESMKSFNNNLPLMFSPGYMVSRWKLASGTPIWNTIKRNPRLASMIVKDYAVFAGTAGGLLAGLKASGANVEMDVHSSNFGKVMVGDQWVDPFSGILAPYRVIAQITQGGTTQGGNTVKPWDPGTAFRYLEYKSSPAVRTAFNVGKGMTGQESFGKSYDPRTAEGIRNTLAGLSPIAAQNVYEIWTDKSLNEAQKTAMTIGAVMGLSANTPLESKETGSGRSSSRSSGRSH